MKNQTSQLKKKLARSFWIRSVYFMAMWIRNYPSFLQDYMTFRRLSATDQRFSSSSNDLFPCLFDKTKKTSFDPYYIYHAAWGARIVAKIKPMKHIDISSTLHFSTLVSAFVPVEFYDYRPADIVLDNLDCKKGDLTNLPFQNNSLESISCMHTIEHVGLGRYGDPVDPNGDIRAARELSRVVKQGGTLIFAAPIGRPRIEFNAHRIYSYDQIIALFPNMKIREFSLIPDDFARYGLIRNSNKDTADEQSLGCGCFWFIKK